MPRLALLVVPVFFDNVDAGKKYYYCLFTFTAKDTINQDR